MAELADAADSKSAEGNLVGVRPPLPAPIKQTDQVNLASPDRRGQTVAEFHASRNSLPHRVKSGTENFSLIRRKHTHCSKFNWSRSVRTEQGQPNRYHRVV
jgi:hypothetical protein